MTGLILLLVVPLIVAGGCFSWALWYLFSWSLRERKKEYLAGLFKFTSLGYLVLSIVALIMILENPMLGFGLGLMLATIFGLSALGHYFCYRLIVVVIDRGL